MTDIFTGEKRTQIMSRVKNCRTEPEEKVAKILRELSIGYRRNVKTLPGQPDLVVYSLRTAIFVNGCFWHGHNNCPRAKLPKTNRTFWQKKITTNRRRDGRSIRQLREQNWHTITVWQCRLRNTAQVKSRLARLLADRSQIL
jgi:DNA mismatch endonuclease, patch repair protein